MGKTDTKLKLPLTGEIGRRRCRRRQQHDAARDCPRVPVIWCKKELEKKNGDSRSRVGFELMGSLLGLLPYSTRVGSKRALHPYLLTVPPTKTHNRKRKRTALQPSLATARYAFSLSLSDLFFALFNSWTMNSTLKRTESKDSFDSSYTLV